MTRPSPTDTLRLGLGAAAVLRPGLLLTVGGADDRSGARRVVRVLGARYLVQAVVGAALGRPWVRVVNGGVDLVHAVSMLGLAAVDPEHRGPALLSAAAASGFAAADLPRTGSGGRR